MKTKIAQKALAAAVVFSLVATPLTAFATAQATAGSTPAPAPAATASTPATVTTASPSTTAADAKVTVAGTTLYATAAGASTVKSVPAVVVTAPTADLTSALSLGKGERAFSTSYDITPKTAPASYAAISDAAASQGATLLGMVNMNIGKMSGGKFTAADGSVRVKTTMALPANANTDAQWSVAVVSPGGATRIEKDQDTNPKTCTFNANGGLGAYGLMWTP